MIGSRIVRVGTVDSTNSLAASMAEHGLVVVADYQTAGRGQYGRSWLSEPGDSLLMSVVVCPTATLQCPSILTAWAAVGVGDAIEDLLGVRPRIKWPNDLLLRDRKLCGILCESTRDSTVVGIGLNLTQNAERFADASLPAATSLALERSASYDRLAILANVVRRLDERWAVLESGDVSPLESDWREAIGLVGWPVRAELFDGSAVTGRLVGLSFAGLELATDEGRMSVVPCEAVRGLRGL
jgi:BirA family biotin operon repressor/biotin-[acetyl-CoA-carboxylase] ligase